MKTTLMSLLVLISAVVPARAAAHDPAALFTVLTRVRDAATAGEKPVVILDLDDTLIDAGSRTLRILREVAAEPAIDAAHPGLAARLAALPREAVRYDLGENMRMLEVADATSIARFKEAWLARFFTSAYCRLDDANPGAATYVTALHAAGAHVIYLTGRDEGRMGDGTRQNLMASGFPLDASAELILKQDPAQDDTAFKIQVFERLRALGRVVAGFENEPRNVNAMGDAFPGAQMVFVDTRHSANPDVPHADIPWVADFRTARR